MNCVLYRNYPADQLVPYMERFRKIPGASIQFRFDYTATTPENLYEEKGDKILQDLKKVARYTGLDGCRMRCGFHFDYKGMELTYHKTLPYSTIVEKDPADGVTYDILYDILIKQNGDIHSDWDGTVMDVDAYEKVVSSLTTSSGWPGSRDRLTEGGGSSAALFEQQGGIPMRSIQTVGIVGLGALGVMYADLFTQALGKERVLVLADRGRIGRYRQEGIWCNGRLCDFSYTDAAQQTEPVDLLLFAVKFGGLKSAVETCRHLVGPDTILISVLNGISSEQILGDAFGPEKVVWCVAERMSAKKEGNHVTCGPTGDLALGVPAGADDSASGSSPPSLTGSASPIPCPMISVPICGASCCATPAPIRPRWCFSATTAWCRSPAGPGTP